MINSRNLDDLHPKVKTMVMNFIAECKNQGVDILITSTYRDAESQNALYDIGRTVMGANPTPKKPLGNVVTNAKAGESFHNWRVAVDFVPIIHGKAVWSDESLFVKCGEIAESVGLEWAGRWKKFQEMAHCQFTGGLTLHDFQLGKTF